MHRAYVLEEQLEEEREAGAALVKNDKGTSFTPFQFDILSCDCISLFDEALTPKPAEIPKIKRGSKFT